MKIEKDWLTIDYDLKDQQNENGIYTSILGTPVFSILDRVYKAENEEEFIREGGRITSPYRFDFLDDFRTLTNRRITNPFMREVYQLGLKKPQSDSIKKQYIFLRDGLRNTRWLPTEGLNFDDVNIPDLEEVEKRIKTFDTEVHTLNAENNIKVSEIYEKYRSEFYDYIEDKLSNFSDQLVVDPRVLTIRHFSRKKTFQLEDSLNPYSNVLMFSNRDPLIKSRTSLIKYSVSSREYNDTNGRIILEGTHLYSIGLNDIEVKKISPLEIPLELEKNIAGIYIHDCKHRKNIMSLGGRNTNPDKMRESLGNLKTRIREYERTLAKEEKKAQEVQKVLQSYM